MVVLFLGRRAKTVVIKPCCRSVTPSGRRGTCRRDQDTSHSVQLLQQLTVLIISFVLLACEFLTLTYQATDRLNFVCILYIHILRTHTPNTVQKKVKNTFFTLHESNWPLDLKPVSFSIVNLCDLTLVEGLVSTKPSSKSLVNSNMFREKKKEELSFWHPDSGLMLDLTFSNSAGGWAWMWRGRLSGHDVQEAICYHPQNDLPTSRWWDKQLFN